MKKGFTLIEIILSITLITLIGVTTIILVINNNKNKEIKLLEKYSTTLENALNVYLDSHPEVMTNLNENAKAAIVTLETLKSEGLISDKLNVSYKNNYYLLSNLKLLANESEDKTCDNNVIGIDMIKSWDLNKYDSKSVIYVCPKGDSESLDELYNNLFGLIVENDRNIDNLERRIESLEELHSKSAYYYPGEDQNNYVYFNTNYSSSPNNVANFDGNLFRILSKTGLHGENDYIYLIPSKPITINENFKTIFFSGYFYSEDLYSYNKYSYNNSILKDYNYWITGKFCNLKSNKNLILNIGWNINNGNYVVGFLDNKERKKYLLEEIIPNKTLYEIALDVSNGVGDIECTKIKYNNVDHIPIINYSISMQEQLNIIEFANNNSNYSKNSLIHSDPSRGPFVLVPDLFSNILKNLKYDNWVDQITFITENQYKKTFDDNNKTWLSYINYGLTNEVIYESLYFRKKQIEYNHDYYPVIVLKQGVKIIDNPNCSNDGSESCPYRLEYEGDTTSAS